jgi:uncharacterized GH25 family protein
MKSRLLPAILALALSTSAAQSHEFWIEPQDYAVDPGAPVQADLFVGEAFEGLRQSYIPRNFRRFEMAGPEGSVPVTGRAGDRPAVNQAAGEGLQVIVHETTDSVITWRDFADFEAFVRHKDAEWSLSRHAERGLPDKDFAEAFSRYAKSLVAVGAGAGSDAPQGLEVELTARANPYTDDVSAGFPVALAYQGAPWANAQIEMFEKGPDGSVAITTHLTDDEGRATLPVRPGHSYMLDAVLIREPSATLAQDRGVVWESLWANLTFAVPGD